VFPVGSDVEVIVLEADAAGRRIRVSRKAVIDAQEAQELRDYHERTAAEDTNAVGSLADKLRGALQGRKPDR
jgi:ribosomal protein S1